MTGGGNSFFDDGMNLEGMITARPGLHGSGRFLYRLAGPHLQFQYGRLAYGLPKQEVDRILLEVIKPNLQELYCDGPGGEERVLVDEKNLLKLKAGILTTIAEHVVGNRNPYLREALGKSPTGSSSSDSTPTTPTETVGIA